MLKIKMPKSARASTTSFSRPQARIIFLENMENLFGKYVTKEESFFCIEGPIIFNSSIRSKLPRVFRKSGVSFLPAF